MDIISYYIKFKPKEIWFMKNYKKWQQNTTSILQDFWDQDIPSYALNDTGAGLCFTVADCSCMELWPRGAPCSCIYVELQCYSWLWPVINRVLSVVEIRALRLESKYFKGFFWKINFPPMKALRFMNRSLAEAR